MRLWPFRRHKEHPYNERDLERVALDSVRRRQKRVEMELRTIEIRVSPNRRSR